MTERRRRRIYRGVTEHGPLTRRQAHPLDKLTPQLIQRLIVDKERERVAQTVRHIHRVLHLALDHPVEMRLLAANPADDQIAGAGTPRDQRPDA